MKPLKTRCAIWGAIIIPSFVARLRFDHRTSLRRWPLFGPNINHPEPNSVWPLLDGSFCFPFPKLRFWPRFNAI